MVWAIYSHESIQREFKKAASVDLYRLIGALHEQAYGAFAFLIAFYPLWRVNGMSDAITLSR